MNPPEENRPSKKFLPIFLSVALVIGIWLGSKLAPPGNQPIIFPTRAFNDVNKLNEILNYIRDVYVDTVNKKELVESSIENLLEGLDPHSYYIPAKDFSRVTEPLEGNMEGIGVEFRIINDTLVVLLPMENGPSQKAGIQAGDRVVKVNDSLVAGIGITNEGIIALLKGKKGTSVQLGIKRKGEAELLTFDLTREKVPIKSIESAYMIDETIGYVKISRFSKTTHEDFVNEMEKLKDLGLRNLIIDLRNNGGGFLSAATEIADEFLANNELIVYTEGRARPRQSVYAESNGLLKKTELYILINEHSASASEVLSGAIQDNDRGTIVGRRSFGKGLVQEQIDLPDGSAVRLTVAKYYTPTGRSIQKPFGENIESYRRETYDRNKKGELLSPDNIEFPDSLKFTTPKGNIVYGGGGIMPDVFVAIDTTQYSAFLKSLLYQGVFQDLAFEYVDENRTELQKYVSSNLFHKNFRVSGDLLNKLVEKAKAMNIKPDYNEVYRKNTQIIQRLRAEIAQNIWGTPGYLYIRNQHDEMILRAIALIKDKK